MHRMDSSSSSRRSSFLVSAIDVWFAIFLFPFVPAGFGVQYAHMAPVTVFVVNFLAIIPSSILLGYAIDQIARRAGDILSCLVNMTFGLVSPQSSLEATNLH